ncbi:DMT family transporter [Cloacibacillus evryensis]|uniref:DMT family transporter n=1 Tax=Cloacibacillus evryensis TaxID=508460 RepID=UPI0004BAF8F1|nr:DMT family transporter [Cloacibacillus evryensis]MEA5033777.1 DMT family transporter [Cloacibacillus evryensis]
MPPGELDNARPDGPRLYDYIIILTTVIIWGGSFASTKYALAQAEPSLILLLRFLFGIPVLAAGCLFEKSLRLPTKEEAVILLLIGFQGIFFHQGIQAVAMKTAGAGNANWMMVASPAIVAVLGRIFLGEKISRAGVFGLILSAVGVTMVLAWGTVKETAETGSFGTVGDYIILLSVLNWAVFLIASRKFLKTKMSPAFSIFWEMIFAFFYALVTSFAVGTDFSQMAAFTTQTWLSILFLGALSSAFAYLLWYQALAVMPVAKLIVFQFLQPVAGMVISYFLIGERYTLWLAFGAAMIMSGIWLVNKR